MHDSLQRMLSRGAGALKVRGQCVLRLAGWVKISFPSLHFSWPPCVLHQALTSGFSTALLALLLLGVDSSAAKMEAERVLRKCGGADLVAEVHKLAMELSRLVAVTEAVAAPWYEKLSSDLL